MSDIVPQPLTDAEVRELEEDAKVDKEVYLGNTCVARLCREWREQRERLAERDRQLAGTEKLMREGWRAAAEKAQLLAEREREVAELREVVFMLREACVHYMPMSLVPHLRAADAALAALAARDAGEKQP